MSSFQQQKSQIIQRNRKLWLIQRKKKHTPIETIPENDLSVDLLDTHEHNHLKDAQKTKGKHYRSQENNVRKNRNINKEKPIQNSKRNAVAEK